MSATTVVFLVLAFLVAYALAWSRPEATKKWFRRIMRFRGILGAVGGVLVALLFIGTGVPELGLIGFLGLVYGSLYVIYEEPHKVIVKWIPI